ncbi:MAG: 16S rRNA (guanine(966)-N(2))-methyltransferase RsmD [Candidatus Comchoanobacterales bacterium]
MVNNDGINVHPKTQEMTQNYTIRIQAGSLKGRILTCTTNHVRPTGQRTRETLFNWLTPYIHQAKCLDIFSGTGILAFEAISRGAQSCLCLDRSIQCIEHISQHADLFNCNNLSTQKHLFPNPLTHTEPFDIIFIDPPFNSISQSSIIQWVKEHQHVHSETLIYFERHAREPLDHQWHIHREKKYSNVCFGLYQL